MRKHEHDDNLSLFLDYLVLLAIFTFSQLGLWLGFYPHQHLHFDPLYYTQIPKSEVRVLPVADK